jgi:hypothetical protein
MPQVVIHETKKAERRPSSEPTNVAPPPQPPSQSADTYSVQTFIKPFTSNSQQNDLINFTRERETVSY